MQSKPSAIYQRALAIFEQVYHETPNHPDIASTFEQVWGMPGVI